MFTLARLSTYSWIGGTPQKFWRPRPSAARPKQQGNEAEMEFWREVKDCDDPEEIELYIEQFPQGVYVELARKKIAELGG